MLCSAEDHKYLLVCNAYHTSALQGMSRIASNDVLDSSGWKISEGSIRAGLETTRLLGRSQFLTSEEAEALGLSNAMIMLDGGSSCLYLLLAQFQVPKLVFPLWTISFFFFFPFYVE